MVTNLGESAFAEQTRVECRNQAFRRPSAAAGRLCERIQALPSGAKDVSVKTLGLEGVEPLQQCRIMNHDALLDEDAVAKLSDHVADLVGPPFLDQLGRRLPA